MDAVLFHPLHDGGQHFVFLLHEFIEDHAPLRLPDPLHHHLLGGLGGDAAEFAGVHLFLQHVPHLVQVVDLPGVGQADLRVGVIDLLHHGFGGEDLHLAGIPVHHGPHVAVGSIVALVGCDQGGFKGVDEDILADSPLPLNVAQGGDEFGIHRSIRSLLISQKLRSKFDIGLYLGRILAGNG